jgi:NTE family protein
MSPAFRHPAAIVAALSLLVPASVSAKVAEATAPSQSRPRIGLVLGGGGAMGAAHIGVIKVLEELHVPVDCIAGTSMGALVGGAYASGMDGAELEKFVTSIDWRAVFSREQVRLYQPMSVKRDNETISNKLEFGLDEEGLSVPRSLVETQQIESLIRSMVATQSSVDDFDQLPIPFRAIATDLKSGGMVVFRSGELPVALRASMSVPGAFAPIEVGDWLLVDGGITRNLPVDVARETCADVVIAIAVDSPDPPVESMRSATGSLGRMLEILIETNEQASLDSLQAGDVGLNVVLEGVGSADFNLSRLAIDQGERAARAAAAELVTLSVPSAEYAAWREGLARRAPITPAVMVADIRFEGIDARTAEYLQTLIRSRAGETLQEERIADDALRIYATDAYESVAHRVEGPAGAPVVVFTPVPKSWGPTYLAFDYGLESSLSGEPEFLGSVLLHHIWPDSGGIQWRGLAQLGGETIVETDLRVPFGTGRHAFLLPRIGWYSTDEDIFVGDERAATYAFRSLRGEMRSGVEMGTWGELQAGLYWRSDDTVREIGNLALPEERDYRDAGYLLEFDRDTRDSDLWATRGSRQRLEVQVAEPGLGATDSYQSALFEWNKSAVFGPNALLFVDFAGGSAFGSKAPAQQAFRLGGPGALTGLERGRLRGADFLYTRLGLGWRLTDVDSLVGMDLFGGVALEAGNVWDRIDGASASGLLLGGQLFLGGNTPLGPVSVAAGYVEGGDFAFFLSLGRPVRARWR